MRTDLSRFNNQWYQPGPLISRVLWYFTGAAVLRSALPGNSHRRFWLRLFGAKVGKGVVIKPRVIIKYPWKLEIGDHAWIGEQVWIDNLGKVTIGSHSCLSQGAMLLCGNHDYTKIAFDLMVGDITLEDGVWIGARSTVCPGALCRSHSVLSVGSVLVGEMEAYSIYRGNPAVKIRERKMEE
ncbi:MAG: hypothetical protein RL220_1714 [Bacteroidota bacterium]